MIPNMKLLQGIKPLNSRVPSYPSLVEANRIIKKRTNEILARCIIKRGPLDTTLVVSSTIPSG